MAAGNPQTLLAALNSVACPTSRRAEYDAVPQ
jgi:hypothetical protein